MNRVLVKPGDTFFIKANHVHSIGAGTMLAEIQQTSDITYRIYDFNRRDQAGNLRELHVDQAFEVMNLGKDTGQVEYENGDAVQLVSVPEFHTTKYQLKSSQKIQAPIDHFSIIIAVKGKGSIKYQDTIEALYMSETILIQAVIEVKLMAEEAGKELLETHLK